MCFRRADISSRCSTGTGTLLQGKSYFKINKLLIQTPSINIEKFMVTVQGNRTLKFVCENSNFSILCVLEKQITTDVQQAENYVLMKISNITVLVKFLVIDLANGFFKTYL